MKERIAAIDIAKGIAILSVILAHTLPFERGGLREVIYSFHMPLFFIVSGYTSSNPNNIWEIFHRFFKILKKLAIPMVTIWIVMLLYSLIFRYDGNYSSTGDFIIKKSLQLLYASGVTNSQLVIFGGGNIEALGFAWFFAAMIGAKVMYDLLQLYLRNYWLLLFVILFSLDGVWLGRMYHFPMSLDISFAVLPFLWIGQELKRFGVSFDWRKCFISLVSWALLWLVTNRYGNWNLEMAGRSYPLFPLCFIEAFAGTMCVLYFSDLISRFDNCIKHQLVVLGQGTLNILVIHCIDFLWADLYMITDMVWINILIRVMLDLVIFYLYREIKSKVSTAYLPVNK